MKSRIYILGAIVVLVAPVAFYIVTFGIGIWDSHSDWAAMGSAIGGLYTPILALLTLAVLIKQLQIQAQVKDYEQRESSRKIVFEMVDKFASRIESLLDENLKQKLRVLSELPEGHPKASQIRSDLLDVFTLWTSVRSFIIKYAEKEPAFLIDLLSIPVLHLNFKVCYDIDKAYLIHLIDGDSEPYLYPM
ncbi:TPA: hypothetical protein ACGUTZ_004303 [Vibrio vulnificus]